MNNLCELKSKIHIVGHYNLHKNIVRGLSKGNNEKGHFMWKMTTFCLEDLIIRQKRLHKLYQNKAKNAKAMKEN